MTAVIRQLMPAPPGTWVIHSTTTTGRTIGGRILEFPDGRELFAEPVVAYALVAERVEGELATWVEPLARDHSEGDPGEDLVPLSRSRSSVATVRAASEAEAVAAFRATGHTFRVPNPVEGAA